MGMVRWLWNLVRTRRHCWQSSPGVSEGWVVNHNLKAQLLLSVIFGRQRLGMDKFTARALSGVLGCSSQDLLAFQIKVV